MTEVRRPERFEPDALMEALLSAGVRFVLIGGLAVGVHGAVRATQDVDVVPDPEGENLERLARVLRRLEARQIGVNTGFLPNLPTEAKGLAAGGSFQLATVHGQLDVLQESAVIPSYATLAEDALEVDWRGHALRVCSLARLREMKRAAGRPLDALDLEALAAAHGER